MAESDSKPEFSPGPVPGPPVGLGVRLRRRWDRYRSYRLARRVEALEVRVQELQARLDGVPEAQLRWKNARPDPDLTWGRPLTGHAFVKAVEDAGGFGTGKSVVEVGPGYGRILQSMLSIGLPFGRYVGVEISAENVHALAARFSDPRVSFVLGDAATARLRGTFDTAVSSLVFKHLFPTFEGTVRNLRSSLREGALLIFDLLPPRRFGWVSYLNADPAVRPETTFVRRYSREEVRSILERCGFEIVAFSRVRHDPRHSRLLVIARASAQGRDARQVVPTAEPRGGL